MPYLKEKEDAASGSRFQESGAVDVVATPNLGTTQRVNLIILDIFGAIQPSRPACRSKFARQSEMNMLGYRSLAPGCIQAKASDIFDLAGEALGSGFEHVDRLTGNHSILCR